MGPAGRLASLGLAALAAGPASAEEPLCGRVVLSFEQTAAELARDPRFKPVPNGGADFQAYQEDEPSRLWFVTKPHYPLIKAVICRSLHGQDGRFFIRAETRCFGPKERCEPLAAAFGQATN